MSRLIQSPQQLAMLLKTTRQARGLTQAAVASSLGVSQNRYSELERDPTGLTLDRLLELTRLLELELLLQKKTEPLFPTDLPSGNPSPAW